VVFSGSTEVADQMWKQSFDLEAGASRVRGTATRVVASLRYITVTLTVLNLVWFDSFYVRVSTITAVAYRRSCTSI